MRATLILLHVLWSLLVPGNTEFRVPWNGRSGAYCSRLPPHLRCCTGRQNHCSVPTATSLCYCDERCKWNGKIRDCCPDYESVCEKSLRIEDLSGSGGTRTCYYASKMLYIGQQIRLEDDCHVCTCTWDPMGFPRMNCTKNCNPPTAPSRLPLYSSYYNCYHPNRKTTFSIGDTIMDGCRRCICKADGNGGKEMTCHSETCSGSGENRCFYSVNSRYYNVGDRIKDGNKDCICKLDHSNRPGFVCDDDASYSDIYNIITKGKYGWIIAHYPFLVGKSLEEVYEQRTNVCRPKNEPSTFHVEVMERLTSAPMESFDARDHWPGRISPISENYLDRPDSWAVSTAEIASDRWTIARGAKLIFSAQNLIDCVKQSNPHCASTATAWDYASNYGLVTEACYPRKVGHYRIYENKCNLLINSTLNKYVTCPFSQDAGKLYRLQKYYKLENVSEIIQGEIYAHGPVQAHIRVEDDFYRYRSGVYWHVAGYKNSNEHYLAVRIIGWGLDHSEGKATKYWLCANSWGKQWGEGGYFKIRRGQNDCDIEAHVYGVHFDAPGNVPERENLYPTVN